MPVSKLGLIKAGFLSLPVLALFGWRSYLPHTPPQHPGSFSVGYQLDHDTKLVNLRKALQEFRLGEAKMTPADQAAEWLRLFTLSSVIDRTANADSVFDDQAILNLVPPPAAWSEFERLVKGRVAAGDKSDSAALVLLADALAGDEQSEYALIQARIKSSELPIKRSRWTEAYQEVVESNGDVDEYGRQWLAHLQAGTPIPFYVPNLVPILGRRRAREVLKEAINLRPLTFYQTDPDTVDLCAQVCLDQIATLKIPQWDAAKGSGNPRLEAELVRRFPHDADSPGFAPTDGRPAPRTNLAESMIAELIAGKTEKVAKEILDKYGYPFETYQLMHGFGNESYDIFDPSIPDDPKRAKAIFNLFSMLLKAHPKLPLWDGYMQAAQRLHRLGDMIALVAPAVEHNDIGLEHRRAVLGALWQAMIETGRLEEGVGVMRRLLNDPGYRLYAYESVGTLGTRLARIGAVTKHREWVRIGLSAASGKAPSTGEIQKFIDDETPEGPDDEKHLAAWAGAYDRAFLWSDAADRYAKYIRIHPDAFGAKARLAKLDTLIGRPGNAEKLYEEAFREMAFQRVQVRGDQDDWETLYQRYVGFFDDNIGLPIAWRVFTAAAKEKPNRPEPHFWLGKVWEFAGRYDDAKNEYLKAVKLAPDYAEPLAQLLNLGRRIMLSGAEQDDLACALASGSLDMPSVHSWVRVHDFHRYWNVLAKNKNLASPESLPPYPLAGQLSPYQIGGYGPVKTVSQGLGQTEMFSVVAQLLEKRP